MPSGSLSARPAPFPVGVGVRASFNSRIWVAAQSRRLLALTCVLAVGCEFATADEVAHPEPAEQTADAATETQSDKQPSEPPKKLDLQVRDLATLVAEGYVKLEEDEETVTVTGRKEEMLPQTDSERPEPWMGIAAPVWAVLNPTQAWRIFLPVPEHSAEE